MKRYCVSRKIPHEKQNWIAFYATHSEDKISLQKTTFSYDWMTEVNACLYTLDCKFYYLAYATNRRITPITITETQNDVSENRRAFLSITIMIIWFSF
jgi:hypothetical protein